MNFKSSELGNLFIKSIQDRLFVKNKNWIACICGEPGSGKSYAALSLGSRISKNVHLVLTPIEFMDIIANDKAQAGDVIIFDEAGVGMSARQWMTVQNKLIGGVLQTFRHKNLALIFTVPNMSFVDVQARTLLNCIIETKGIDYETKKCKLKILNIQVNALSGEPYKKFPIFRNPKTGRSVKMDFLRVSIPSAETIKWYEEKKVKFTKEYNASVLEELKPKEKEVKKNSIEDLQGIADIVLNDKDAFFKKLLNGKVLLDLSLLQVKFNISERDALKVKALVNAGGNTLTDS